MKKKKGISLIVLIVTIIVIIILAAAVILTITKNNPVSSAKESAFKEDVRTFQDDLALKVAKEYTDKQGQRNEKISTSDYDKIKEYIPSFSEKYKGKFVIEEDKLVGTDELTKNEKTWTNDVNISISGKASFDANKWDKNATPENCFIWKNDTKGEEGYNVIVGYKENLTNYPKVRIPSRCQKIICDASYSGGEYSDDGAGRSFLNNVQKIEIPETVTEIGNYAFGGIFGNALKSVTEIDIPDSVTSIGGCALYNCSSLTSIKIPDSVTSIGGSAFYNCSSLTSIKIPDSVVSIGDCAFGRCSGLTSITIPEGVTSIGNDTFELCSSLADITIPNSVTNIGSQAFSCCSSLANINFKGTKEQWNSISKGSLWNLESSIKTITCTDGVITL